VFDGSVNRVDSWADRSSYALHTTAASTTARPVYEENVLNGQPGIYFPVTGRYLHNTQVALTFAQPNTMFAVYQPTTAWTTSLSLIDGNNDSRHIIRPGYNNSARRYQFYAGTSEFYSLITPSHLDPIIASAVFNGANSVARVNGTVLTTTGNFGALGYRPLRIGVRSSGTGDWYIGYAFALICYAGQLSTIQIESVEQYLSTKYGIGI
jgi:hypothetical protein